MNNQRSLTEGDIMQISRIPVGNIMETESSVIATFELPGVEKENIQLNIDEEIISVKVENKTQKEAKEKDSCSYKVQNQSFYGALPLPAEIVADNANATFKNGILRVEVPKARKIEEKKRIQVN